jgi:hypothetical protein
VEVASKTNDVAALYSRMATAARASTRMVGDELIETAFTWTIPGTSRMVGMAGFRATYGLSYAMAADLLIGDAVLYRAGAFNSVLGPK